MHLFECSLTTEINSRHDIFDDIISERQKFSLKIQKAPRMWPHFLVNAQPVRSE